MERYEAFKTLTHNFAAEIQCLGGQRCNGETMRNLRQRYIRELVSCGIPVARLQGGTTIPPKGSRGFRDASLDVSWLDQHPGSNFTIPTGRDSGLVALDVDAPDGFSQLGELVADNRDIGEQLAHALAVRSPSGGVHLWFPASNDEIVSKAVIGFNKVEIKASNTALTGPLSWRRPSDTKQGGSYMPALPNPYYQAQILNLHPVIIDFIRTQREDTVVRPADWLTTLQPTSTQRRSETTANLTQIKNVTREHASTWFHCALEHFCNDLTDGHSSEANRILWTASWLVRSGLLNEEMIRTTLTKSQTLVRYSNNVERSSPYSFDAQWNSVQRRITQIEATAPELSRSELAKAQRVVQRYEIYRSRCHKQANNSVEVNACITI